MIRNLGVDLKTFQLCSSWSLRVTVRVSCVAQTVRRHRISCETEPVLFSHPSWRLYRLLLELDSSHGTATWPDLVPDRRLSDVLSNTSKLHDTFDSISI